MVKSINYDFTTTIFSAFIVIMIQIKLPRKRIRWVRFKISSKVRD